MLSTLIYPCSARHIRRRSGSRAALRVAFARLQRPIGAIAQLVLCLVEGWLQIARVQHWGSHTGCWGARFVRWGTKKSKSKIVLRRKKRFGTAGMRGSIRLGKSL